jgi:copper chaperone CopZ
MTSLALVILLTLVGVVSSEASPGYISNVEIHVDGFICATCVRQIEESLKFEKGVARVTGNWEEGIVAVIPDQMLGWVDLFDIESRINSTRNYSVLKMDVVAVGALVKAPVEYYVGGIYAYSGDRYRLHVGENRKSYFVLAEGEKLSELAESGAKAVRAMGTVSAFSREKVPIMELTDFQELAGEEAEKAVESYETGPQVIPDQIVSVEMYIDGFICATCVRILESNLMTEEGVASVEANLETGVVTVTPALDDEIIDPFYLRRRVNSLEDYTVRRMDVEAIGTLAVFPARYFKVREYTHSHDRYKLQVGDKFFVLADNRKLHELIESGLKRVRLKGTVLAVNEGKSILSIGVFQPVGAREEMATYDDPMDTFIAEDEEEILEEAGRSQIESVRVYVDGFICATCETPIMNALLDEEGVKIAATDAAVGLIELVPKEGQTFDLLDIEQRINAMREYKVLKMDVVATGKIEPVEMGYGEDTLYPEKSTRYILSAGESGNFLISENDVLAKILKSDGKAFAVAGTISSFWGNVPILAIRDYKEFEEYPDWLK